MFIGHGLLAFAVVALLGRRIGWSREGTLWLAVLAGGFATLPDVDMVYAPVGLLGGASGAFGAAEAFWQTGNVVHRVLTHSLVVGLVAAVAFGGWTAARDWDGAGFRGHWTRRQGVLAGAGIALLGGLVGGATLATGGLAGVIMAVFVAAGLGLTTVAARRGVTSGQMVGMALVGLLSHPFGDMVTGSPPALLYPFDLTLVADRFVLHPDPTLHLVGAFVVELSTFWLAAYAYCRLRDERVREYVSPRAAVGVGYAAAALLIPAPTLAASSHFVFSILAVGFVGSVGVKRDSFRGGAAPFRTGDRAVLTRGYGWLFSDRRPVAVADVPTALVTGLTAVTLAVTGYTIAYLIV
ncbi:metal-dependent hydrolase [Halorientalis salina]|uniref:metal-dependent hydrolase n=1 Tax=Halorientalis salina TaxID=2932266 RepID=UPI0010AD6992|nr:metal-dependent hydrolase [Halorientalis salina]